jgi:hypothetical protein
VVVLCLSTGLSKEQKSGARFGACRDKGQLKGTSIILPSHVLVCIDLKGSQCPH